MRLALKGIIFLLGPRIFGEGEREVFALLFIRLTASYIHWHRTQERYRY